MASPMLQQKERILASFDHGMVGAHEPLNAVLLALVLRQVMPSLSMPQVDEMVTWHLEDIEGTVTSFSNFCDWLFSMADPPPERPKKEAPPAPKTEAEASAPSPPATAAVAPATVADPSKMPEDTKKKWAEFKDLLKNRQYLESSTSTHPLAYHVRACQDAFAAGQYEDAGILLERISSSIVEDEKRIAAAFHHFDKDSSGVLERQEFQFMCAYLGWSSHETNSIDVNKDGTVTLGELQTFVGYLGGVQKFFEQRRKRVSASGKDGSEICSIVGVEVGARVRAHFYYKNGQKSESWREAQVLSVRSELSNGRGKGILLEFGFDEAKGTNEWTARQVVPPSWIISSVEETSLAAALREVGILDDSQALWSMVFPMSELRSVQALVSCQRAALSLIRQQATASHENALPELRERFTSLGYGDYELQAVFSWVRDLAPLVVHVHLDRMGQFLESDEFYRNQFETKTSCGALDDGNETRTGWERTLFGESYTDAKPFDRCKYGALNVTNDYRGVTSASQYGDSYLVLKDSRLRATFCSTDSGGIAGSRLGVCDRYGHVLKEYNDDELNEITRVAVAALPTMDGKSEGHIPKSAWPKVLRGESEDAVKEWITVGYPALAQKGSGRYAFEVELYGTTYAPQVGLLSEDFVQCLGVRSTSGVGDDEFGWALDAEHYELWHRGEARCWQGAPLAGESGGKQVVGVAVDLAERKIWFGVNGVWFSAPGFESDLLPEGVSLYPAVSFQGRAAFVFQDLCHPPPEDQRFLPWPRTHRGKFRIDCPRIGNSDVLNLYKEFQIHGEVCLKKHVQRLVATNKYREAVKYERSRNIELTKAGARDGTYCKAGAYNDAPLYHCASTGWLYFDRPRNRWVVKADSEAESMVEVGATITAQRTPGGSQAGIVAKILEDDKVEITWADGNPVDQVKPKDEVNVVSTSQRFKDDGSFELQALADPFLKDTAPPTSGWMATPEASGYVDQAAFDRGMRDLGVDESQAAALASTLRSQTLKGETVIMRRPGPEISFDAEWAKLSRKEDAATAWKALALAAQSCFFEKRGVPKEAQIIQTEHPYPAVNHSWKKEIVMPGKQGMRIIFSEKCKTYDSCASLRVRSGGIPKSTIGPGLRVEVDGLDGSRKFGTIFEALQEERGGRMIRLDKEKEESRGDEEDSEGEPVHVDAPPVPDEIFAFVVEEKKSLSVEYDLEAFGKPGKEISGFVLDPARPHLPVSLAGFAGEGPAQAEGVKDWWRLDLVQTLLGDSQYAFAEIQGDDLGPPPQDAQDIMRNLNGCFRRLQAALQKTCEEGSNYDYTTLTFYFVNGLEYKLMPEAHITFSGRKVSDEIKSFDTEDGQLKNLKVKELSREDGPLFAAGVRPGWIVSVDDTFTEDNPGKKPDLALEDAQNDPTKVLDLENVTLVFECEDAEPFERGQFYGESYQNLELTENSCTVAWETDGDGSSYTDRRWGILALIVPADAEPQVEGPSRWKFTETTIGPVTILSSIELKSKFVVIWQAEEYGSIEDEGFSDLDKAKEKYQWATAQEYSCILVEGHFREKEWSGPWGTLKTEMMTRFQEKYQAVSGATLDVDDAVQAAEEVRDEDGEILYLKLADGRGYISCRDAWFTQLLYMSPAWDMVMAEASEALMRAEGIGDASPIAAREGWDEARLRALCARHGWEFEWMSEDGERRRRGAERQSMMPLPAVTMKADTHCPDGFQPTTTTPEPGAAPTAT